MPMLGRHHLTLSVGTVALIVAPLFTVYPVAVLVAILGSAIGSLIPDADSSDAAIFHAEVQGLEGGYTELLNVMAVLNPAFGYVTKYLIYKPVVIIYDELVFDEYEIREQHRGLLHSFLGLGTMTGLTGVYLVPLLYVFDLFWVGGIGVFLVAYLGGGVLHLVQDSCTRSGIQWNFPFQPWRVRGRISTTGLVEDMRYQRGLLTILGIGVVVMFLVPELYGSIAPTVYAVVGGVVTIVLWTIFVIGIAKCTVEVG